MHFVKERVKNEIVFDKYNKASSAKHIFLLEHFFRKKQT